MRKRARTELALSIGEISNALSWRCWPAQWYMQTRSSLNSNHLNHQMQINIFFFNACGRDEAKCMMRGSNAMRRVSVSRRR